MVIGVENRIDVQGSNFGRGLLQTMFTNHTHTHTHTYIYIYCSVKLKKVFVIELTVPFEENFDWAHQHKLEKYEDLREQCIRDSWIINVCQGFIANSTFAFLTNFDSLSDKRKHVKKIQDKTLTASVWLWHSHRVMTIQQSLVVSWVTAGVLWVSGNDVSALKPCLNPETLPEENLFEAMLLYENQSLYEPIYIYI